MEPKRCPDGSLVAPNTPCPEPKVIPPPVFPGPPAPPNPPELGSPAGDNYKKAVEKYINNQFQNYLKGGDFAAYAESVGAHTGQKMTDPKQGMYLDWINAVKAWLAKYGAVSRDTGSPIVQFLPPMPPSPPPTLPYYNSDIALAYAQDGLVPWTFALALYADVFARENAKKRIPATPPEPEPEEEKSEPPSDPEPPAEPEDTEPPTELGNEKRYTMKDNEGNIETAVGETFFVTLNYAPYQAMSITGPGIGGQPAWIVENLPQNVTLVDTKSVRRSRQPDSPYIQTFTFRTVEPGIGQLVLDSGPRRFQLNIKSGSGEAPQSFGKKPTLMPYYISGGIAVLLGLGVMTLFMIKRKKRKG